MTQPDEAAEIRKRLSIIIGTSANYVQGDQLIDFIIEAQARSRQQLIRQIREAMPEKLGRFVPVPGWPEDENLGNAPVAYNAAIDAMDAVLRKLSKETTE